MRYPLIILVTLLMVACSAPQLEEGTSAEPPNIVVILADDLGYNDIGIYGSQIIKTPNIDQLARDGVRLTDGYVAAAVCSPSRAGLYPGRYQTRFGYEFNTSGRDTVVGLPTDQKTLGNMMKAAGYATGIFGKWQLQSYDPPDFPGASKRRGTGMHPNDGSSKGVISSFLTKSVPREVEGDNVQIGQVFILNTIMSLLRSSEHIRKRRLSHTSWQMLHLINPRENRIKSW